MKRYFKSTLIFFRAIPSIIAFELLYKLTVTAIALPLMAFILQKAIDFSGVGYLTSQNILKFISQPIAFLLVLMILVLCSILTIVEISAIISGFTQLKQYKSIRVFLMFKSGLKSIPKLFKKFNFILILYVLFTLPITQMTISSGIFVSVGLPNIATLYKTADIKVIIIMIAILLIIAVSLIKRIYCLHFFTLTDLNYSESVKQSKKLTEGKQVKTALSIVFWIFFITSVFVLLFFILCFLTAFAVKGFSEPDKAFFMALKTIKTILSIFMAISAIFATPMIFAFITISFIDDIKDIAEIKLPKANKNISAWKIRTVAYVLFGLSIVMNYNFINNVATENLVLDSGLFSRTKVTAHRGFSSIAPENTLPAFIEAVDVGADFIELDVQLSADGEVVVIHDDSLLRTAGEDSTVKSKTYQELLELDYGIWFDEEFINTPIMRLEDVLEQFADEISLNIEVKKTGDEMEIAERTAELISQYGCTDTCYVTSFSYNALKTVKKVNPDIKTGLIANIMTYGGYASLQYIDALSLNQRFVSQNLVNNIHINGKRIFVWTVNDSADMERMINMGVDNIITDKPDTAIKTISSQGVESYIISFLSKIFNY